MLKCRVGVLLALAALLAPAAPAAPAAAAPKEAGLPRPCPPCHCADGVLDCTGLQDPPRGSAAWMQAIAGWNMTGLTAVMLDGSLTPSSAATLPALPAMPGVRSLSLRRNGLADIAPMAFVALPDLTALDLSENQLTADAVRGDSLRGPWRQDGYEPLPRLERLDLSSNALHSLQRHALQHLPALRHLRLDGNPLRVLDHNTQAALASVPSLEVLGLSGCGLTTLGAGGGDPPLPPRLLTLDLAHNKLAAVPRGLPAALNRLVLDGNPIRSLPPPDTLAPPFADLGSLQELSLSYMPVLEAVRAGAFFGLPRLRVLSMAHNQALRQVHDAAFSHLGPSWTLTEVSLRNNSLRWLPPGLLAWRGLAFLDMATNPWHCSCDFTRWAAATLEDTNVNARPEVLCATPSELSGRALWNVSSTACSAALGDAVVIARPSLFTNALLFAVTVALVAFVVLVAHRLLSDGQPRLHGLAARAPRRVDSMREPLYAPAPADDDVVDGVPFPAMTTTGNYVTVWPEGRRGDL